MLALALAAVLSAAPAAPQPKAPVPLGPEWTLKGQRATCGRGPRARTFKLRSQENLVEIGMGLSADAMTFDGHLAPVLEACQGDSVTLETFNAGTMAHGIDSHAFHVNMDRMGPVAPGKSVQFTGELTVPGAFLFHCAAGELTDTHIKSGMWGAMIVYPRKPLPKAKEIAVLQGGFFGAPDAHGVLRVDSVRVAHNDPYVLDFNGRLQHQPVTAKPGERIRVWFVNAGPGISSPHVIGTTLDRFMASGNPANVVRDVQTGLVPAGGGAAFEFRLPEKGMYTLVDHDNLRFLPLGFAIPFEAK